MVLGVVVLIIIIIIIVIIRTVVTNPKSLALPARGRAFH